MKQEGVSMKKRMVSMMVAVAVLASNFAGLEIRAAGNEKGEEVSTVALDAPDYGDMEWRIIDGVLYVPEGIKAVLNGVISAEEYDSEIARMQAKGIAENEIDFNCGDVEVKKIVLPSTVEYIGDNAYQQWEHLEEIVIPGNVKEIGDDAFWACENLKKVVMEDGVEKMGCALFRDCNNLETVILPKAVKEWNTECAFYNCKIKNITLPEEGMTTLGSGMFAGCPLEELNIPDCVTTMNYGVTLECTNLKKIRAGYSVVNFEDGNPRYDLYNFTKGCFGVGCSNMVLEAPLDSAIVEYARYYRYFKVKYDYPDFERVEYSCDGKILENPEWETHENWHKYGYNKYLVYFDFDIYPRTSSSYVSVERLTYNTFGSAREDSPIDEYDYIYRTFKPDGVNYYSLQERIVIKMDGEWEDGYYPEFNYMPTVEYFKMKCYSQGKDFEDELVDEKYFKVTLTKKSFEEKRVQIEILKSGQWDCEDAEWELLTPAIDTTVLTSTPTAMPTKAVTPTATVTPEPEKITTAAPTVTAEPKSKPAITKKVTPTPGVKVVKPAKTSIKSAKQTVVKKQGKKAYKKEVKLSWKKAKYADGYVIYMKSGTGKYKAVKTITKGKTVSYTKKNLKKGRTYYFKIRAYRKANGQKVYGSYSGVKKIKIK